LTEVSPPYQGGAGGGMSLPQLVPL